MRPTKELNAVVWAALIVIGFSAVIGQIVLMRELIVVFDGNEMTLGIMLATWLWWTAAGSSLSASLALSADAAVRAAASLECLLAACLPTTIWLVRTSRSLFQTAPGELVGPLPILLICLVCMSLFCAVSGALFVIAARMAEVHGGVGARIAAGKAYLLEAVGSALGGIAASIVFLRFLDSFQIAIIVALLNLCMAAILWSRMNRRQMVVLAASAVLIAMPLLIAVAPRLNWSAEVRLWRGFHLAATRDTIYGNLAVTETGDLRSIYDNGILLANAPDEAAAEEAIHFALLEHKAPRNVLLIGGGVNGSIPQALKHPTVDRIDYVELDPALIDVARQFFPAQSAVLDSDLRVHVHNLDGRRYLNTADGLFDVIILDVPDPQTAQLNRFYTAEFFRSARVHLAPDGLLALQLRSSEETISPDLAEFLRCIQRTLDSVFPYSAVVPGETIHFFGANQPGVLTEDPQVLIARLRQRGLRNQYVNEYFIPYRMSPDRMAQVQDQLHPLASTPVNRDFAPIAYYFDVVLWTAQFKSGYLSWFRDAAHVPFRQVIDSTAMVLIIAVAGMAFFPGRQRRARSAAAFCAATTGFTLMVLQIILLLAFQSIYGCVYHQLAVLVGVFMAGIAFGSWLSIRQTSKSARATYLRLATTQALLCLSAPLLILAISPMSGLSGRATEWIAAQVVFPACAALAGMLGGYQFPLAAEIFLDDRSGRSGLGILYAVDLLGGCAAALVLSTYLIPVFGFWKTAWLSAAINLAPALLATRVCLGGARSRA
ncbi:MAG: fused MFS/spermidine synthase [Terracidiphilus sp.]